MQATSRLKAKSHSRKRRAISAIRKRLSTHRIAAVLNGRGVQRGGKCQLMTVARLPRPRG